MKLPFIIKKPIITERSMALAAENVYTFEVVRSATKGQIKKAMSDYFGVDVESVRTTIIKGKTKRVGRLKKSVTMADGKKAIIKIKAGQKLDLFEAEAEV